MSDPFISIVITTYNRSYYIRQCLQSIQNALSLNDSEEKVEVIVLDNGSTDDTWEQLKRFEKVTPFRILRIPDNIRFTGGLLKLMPHVRGRYCWILGDDDYVAGSLQPLIDCLKETDADIALINHFFYMDESEKVKFLMKGRSFLLKHPRSSYSNYLTYIRDARHPDAFFTHIAPVIFKRDSWMRYCTDSVYEKYRESESIHTFVLLSILKEARMIGYCDSQLLVLRFGAPPEGWVTEEGRYERIRMDVEYFVGMVSDVFPERAVIRRFKGVILRNGVLVLIIGSKIKCSFSFAFYLRVFRLLYRNYRAYPFFWYVTVPLMVIPRVVYSVPYKLFMHRRG